MAVVCNPEAVGRWYSGGVAQNTENYLDEPPEKVRSWEDPEFSWPINNSVSHGKEVTGNLLIISPPLF